MKFPVIEFPISSFGIDEKLGADITQLVVDASDLCNRHLQPLNEIDRGFIVNIGSGQKITFNHTATEKDADDDIIFWRYQSTTGVKAIVIND